MIKIGKVKEIEKVSHLPEAIIKVVKGDITILDECYGSNRDANKDLGGYVVVVETEEDIEGLEKENLKIYTEIAEYVDNLNVGGEEWVKVLFILSSDFSIVVMGKEEIIKSHKINQ